MNRSAALAFAFFLSAPSDTAAADTKKVHIVYMHGWTYTISSDLSRPVESLVKTGRIKLLRTQYVLSYYSPTQYVTSLPNELRKETLRAAKELGTKPVEIIETDKSILYGSASFMEAVLAESSDPANSFAYLPSARISKKTLVDWESAQGPVQAVSSGGPPSRNWSRTIALHYELEIDGQRQEAWVVAKPLGGMERIAPALRARLSQRKEASLKLCLGDFAIRDIYGISPDSGLAALVDQGFHTCGIYTEDLETAPQLIETYGREQPGRPKLNLIATNLKARSGDAPFAPFSLEVVDGVKIGVITLLPKDRVAAILARKKLPYEALDPTESARAALTQLRAARADLVVLISHLSENDRAKVLSGVSGIDIVLGESVLEVSTRRKTRIDLTGWRKEPHHKPAYTALKSDDGFGDLAMTFESRGKGGMELTAIEDHPGRPQPGEEEDERLAELRDKILAFFISPKDFVLPDARALWSGHAPSLTSREFANIAAGVLRRKAGTEIGFYRIADLHSDIPGDTPESFAWEWLQPERATVKVQATGAQIRRLLPSISREAVPSSSWSREPVNYVDDVWLASSGIDAEGFVNGLPLNDDETYSVAATEDLLELFPVLKSAPLTLGEPLSTTVLNWLKARWKGPNDPGRSALVADIRSMAEARRTEPDLWRIHLRNLSVQFSQTSVINNAPFSQVNDARIQAVPQVLTQGSSQLFSERYWKRVRWDVGATADYGRVTLKPANAPRVVNETVDLLLFETEVRHRGISMRPAAIGSNLGSFVNVAYDTEFTQNTGQPTRRFSRVKSGLKAYDGKWVQELYGSAVAETDYSTPQNATRYGYETGVLSDVALPRTEVRLQTKATYIEFFRSRLDTPRDLKSRLDVMAKLSVPFYAGMRLSPFISYYRFTGQVFQATGYNLNFGVSLDYSRLWKPLTRQM